MSTNPISAVLVYVPDPKEGLKWYQEAFPDAKSVKLPEFDFEYLDVEGVNLEIVKADVKVASGAAGSVVYWYTDDFAARLRYLTSLGATLYRGPMDIENGLRMCQVKDPWGNCIGIRGVVQNDNGL